jgi:sensor histidine kinase regulating citrate/malate metabolism
VILGNMLDNCLKACIANPSSENFIHIAIATTENDKFTIHCENTTAEGTSLEHIHANRQNSLYHGYGLTNIRNTAEKYHGFFTYSVETLFYMDLMIPIIEKSKRIML